MLALDAIGFIHHLQVVGCDVHVPVSLGTWSFARLRACGGGPPLRTYGRRAGDETDDQTDGRQCGGLAATTLVSSSCRCEEVAGGVAILVPGGSPLLRFADT